MTWCTSAAPSFCKQFIKGTAPPVGELFINTEAPVYKKVHEQFLSSSLPSFSEQFRFTEALVACGSVKAVCLCKVSEQPSSFCM